MTIVPEYRSCKNCGKKFSFNPDVGNFKTKVTHIFVMFSLILSMVLTPEFGNVTAKTINASDYLVCLDPGHSAKMPSGTEPIGPGSKTMKAKDSVGTSGVATGVMEYQLTLTLAKKMKIILENRGYNVIMTRNSHDIAISCKERAMVANKAKADIFVRIHADGTSSSAAKGASALYPTTNNPYISKLSGKSKKLSDCLLSELCAKSGAASRGLYGRDDLSGSNWAKMPVSLVEVGFMTNPTEDKKMQKEGYQMRLCRGMVNGIDKYFGLD